ncbi:unnamed protein product [Phytophthora lilii]|uniref:Unnamed protein product n=1 Tax=Phytophthora lilii TaxID=2077276 RepID=A0A9W6X2X3_9STRA|nr:unnamed protein product [Phytophthora lilii]
MAAVLQVADLFDAHAAEAPIHRLVSVLNAQAAQIRELQQTLQMVQTTQRQTLADCSALHAAVASLDPQVQRAEDDVAELNQFRGTAQQQLRAINRQLQGKAERQEVADVDVRAQSASEQLAKQLRSELASLQLVQCLQAEQSELHYRLETVDRRLASKMDKVGLEVARTEAGASLETQVASVQTQQKRIERSVARLDSEREKRQIELEDLRKHTDELQQMLDGAEQRHHRTVGPLVQRLDRSVDELQIAVDELKTTAATSDTALRTLSAKFHSSANAFASQMQQQHCRLEAR